MKAYKVLAEVTTRYTIEVHGEDEDAVYDNVELMGPSQVMEGGEFDSTVDVACISVELMHPEDHDEPDEVVEPVVEPEAEDVFDKIKEAKQEAISEQFAEEDDPDEFESEEETDVLEEKTS